MPHCIHSTKRCHACGLHNGSSCVIVSQARAERIAPPFRTNDFFAGPRIVTEKLDADVMSLLQEFRED